MCVSKNRQPALFVITSYSIHYTKLYEISQTGRTLHSFLLFFNGLGQHHIEQIRRKDIAQYVEREQERGLKINSVRNHLHTVYAFVNYLVSNDILPADIQLKKIRLRMPEILPKAIPAEDVDRILQTISKTRDRALILLLLHTGMRIGELLKVRLADIVITSYSIHYTKLYDQGDKTAPVTGNWGFKPFNRITSYNVCYTKLLRDR